ncbi:MAG: hypothetical protein R2844_14225 [Caldilineales bacterium]
MRKHILFMLIIASLLLAACGGALPQPITVPAAPAPTEAPAAPAATRINPGCRGHQLRLLLRFR